MRRILGIDSGYEKTGFALLKGDNSKIDSIISGVVYTNKTDSLDKRILEFSKNLVKLLDEFKPEIIYMERLFFLNNKKTAIIVAHFQGVVLLKAAERKIMVKTLAPLQVKKAITGNGRADKKSVEKMLYLELPLEKYRREDDETDAIAIAYAGWLLPGR